eukprot:1972434-Pyramimonas_sp.AAC.1
MLSCSSLAHFPWKSKAHLETVAHEAQAGSACPRAHDLQLAPLDPSPCSRGDPAPVGRDLRHYLAIHLPPNSSAAEVRLH